MWSEFVTVLRMHPVEFPALKRAILAQAILECGRGTSNVFSACKNPHGMKWRKELEGIATPKLVKVSSESSGEDVFASFPSYEKAIDGYFKFLTREPYKGWRNHATDPLGFLRFIGPIWCPPSATMEWQARHSGLSYGDYIFKTFYSEADKLLRGDSGMKATWLEFNRTDDGVPSVMAYAGDTPIEEYRGNNKDDMIKFLGKHDGAATFIVADTRKVIPIVSDIPTPSGKPRVDVSKSSPNQSDRGGKITQIVLHNTASSFSSALSWLTNSRARASAHLIIGRDGMTAQIVPFEMRAWNAGNSRVNANSIGIEIEASRPGHGMTPEQDTKVIQWCKWLCDEFDIKPENIGIHRWFSATGCPVWIWENDDKFLAWRKKHFGV